MSEDDGFVRIDEAELEQARKERDSRLGIQRIDAFTSIETPECSNSFEEMRKKVSEQRKTQAYRIEIIRGTLSKKEAIRKAYLSIVETSPARFNDIASKLFGVRQTIYFTLYKLIELGLVYKIPVMSLYEKKKKDFTEDEKIVKKNFEFWTERMKEGMKQYYAAKTNYFALTPLGKEVSLIEWALKKETEQTGTEVIDLNNEIL